MLLSEILKIANLYNNLNEAYQSSTIKKMFDMFNRSSFVYKPESQQRTLYGGLDIYTIKDYYKKLIIEGNYTQDQFDNPETREQLFDIKYHNKFENNHLKKRKKSPITELLYSLCQENCQIDISKITDDDIEWVSLDNSVSKYKYKNGLLFWCDYQDKLRAVTYNNKVIMVVRYYVSWYMNNKNYIGPTDIDKICPDGKTINDDALDSFINKAFLEIPNILILSDPDYIKQEGVTSLKSLAKSPVIIHTYYVKLSAIKKNTIIDKLNTRADYENFLNDQYKLTKEEIHKGKRYVNDLLKTKLKYKFKQRISNRKQAKKNAYIVDEVQDIINLTYDNIFDISEQLHNVEIKYLQKTSDDKFVQYDFLYDKIEIPIKLLSFFKEAMPNKKLQGATADTPEEDKNTFNLNNPGDLFVIMNVYVRYIIHKCNELVDLYNEACDALQNLHDYKKLAEMLNDLSWKLDDYKNICAGVFGNNGFYTRISKIMLDVTGIDCKDIFKVFEPYKKENYFYI